MTNIPGLDRLRKAGQLIAAEKAPGIPEYKRLYEAIMEAWKVGILPNKEYLLVVRTVNEAYTRLVLKE